MKHNPRFTQNVLRDKCKANFREYLKKYTSLAYKDPETFMAKLGSDPEYESLWKDFQCWLYGAVMRDMKDELKAFAEKKDLASSINLDSSSIPLAHSIKHDFAFDMVHKYLDAWTSQYYMNCYWGISHGDPGGLGDLISKGYKNMGKYLVKRRPDLESGLVYMHPACAIDPPQQQKYQILEAVICCPVTGYSVYGETELCDLYYSAQANKMIIPFEDILIDGKMIDDIGVKSETDRSRARAKRLGKDVLILVSDYSTYGSEETQVKVKVPSSLKVLEDVETSERIKTDGDGAFTVKLKDGMRARLFHGSITE